MSSRGHLIAPGHITDECQSITVPGFGHAARVAEDKTNDLALLRLYGARNLTPAPLGGESGKARRLTLFGIRRSAGAGRRRHGDKRELHTCTAQGVEPAPNSAFPARRRSTRKAASPAWWS